MKKRFFWFRHWLIYMIERHPEDAAFLAGMAMVFLLYFEIYLFIPGVR